MRFPKDECDRRIAAVRSLLADRNMDGAVLHDPNNLYYFSGFRTMLHTRFSAVVVTPARAVLVVPTVDEKLACEDLWSPMWLDDVALWGPDDREDVYANHVEALREVLNGAQRIGVDELSFAEHRVLSSAMSGLEFVDLHDDILDIRGIKSASERQVLADAQAAAIAGLQELTDRFTEFGTERDVKVFLDNFAAERGSDGQGYPTLVSCGDKIGAPHSPPLERPLVRGQLVRVAFGPAFSGYSADIVRTYLVGEPTDFHKRCESAYFEAVDALLERLKPGVSCQELLDAVRQVYTRERVTEYWNNNIGHGLGLSIHEPPRIAGSATDIIREGMVLGIEPSLEGGPLGGFYHCNIYYVSATGPELLSPGLNRFLVV